MIQVDKVLRNAFPRDNEGKAGKIRQVSIRITDLCNLRCHTCGQWGDSGFLRSCAIGDLRKQEVSPERYLELLRDLKDHGHTPSMYLWGGGTDASTRDRLRSSKRAACLGMPSSIATNGTGLAQHASRLVEAPMFIIQISVDGPDQATHNGSRPGANPNTDNFGTICRGIDTLREIRKDKNQRLPLLASLTTINNLNYDRLVDIYDVFKDKVDVCVFYLAWWIDEKSAVLHSEDFETRFGFKPEKHFGWIGSWRPPDLGVLSAQLQRLNGLAGKKGGPAVVIMPPLTDEADLNTYYSDHDCRFGFDRCVSIFGACGDKLQRRHVPVSRLSRFCCGERQRYYNNRTLEFRTVPKIS